MGEVLLMKLTFVLALAVLVGAARAMAAQQTTSTTAPTGQAQGQPPPHDAPPLKPDVAFGYSVVRLNDSGPTPIGWTFALTAPVNSWRWLGVTAQIDGNYRSLGT